MGGDRTIGGHSRRRLALALGSVLLFPSAALAQGGLVTFQFSFSNPGARSLGFGGAFVALADDATAAFANPAGLVRLIEPEVSVEVRSWSYSTAFTLGGRLDGEPSGFGLDTIAGLRTAESDEAAAGLSFVAVTYPRERWAWALYRHQLARYRFASETQGLFAEPFPPAEPGGVRRETDVRASTDLDVLGYGLAAAYRVTDALSLGLGVVYYDIRLAARESRFLVDSLDRFFAENSYLPERVIETLRFDVDGDDWGLTAGFSWSISQRWRLGGFYRQGPRARFEGAGFAGPASLDPPPGTRTGGGSAPFAVPDVFGLGLAFHTAGDRLTLSCEWDRVEYRDLVAELDPEERVTVDDGDELRLGGEVVFLHARPVTAVRLGVWLDPDHRLRGTGDDPLVRALFRPGADELHWAAGVGLAFRTFQLDVAADLSDPVDTLSVSTIYSF